MEKDGLELAEVKKHFFKVLVGDFITCLRIPPQFVKNLMDEKEGEINRSNSVPAKIESPSGKIWHVKIEKKMDGLFFTAGWPKFVKDHVLHEYEFLVFRYNGNFHFSILIFSTSGCEKEERIRETPVTREKEKKSSQRWETKTTIEERESQERGSDFLVTSQEKLKPRKDCEIAVGFEEKNEETNKLDIDCEIIVNRGEGKKQVREEDQAKEVNYEEIMKFVRDCQNLATKKRAKDFDLKSLLSAKRKKSTIEETLFKLKKEINKDYKDQLGHSSPDSNVTTNKDGSHNNGSSSSKQKALNDENEVEEITISDMPSHMTNYDGLVNCEGDLKSFKAAMSFQSKFPSLVIHITRYMAKRYSRMRFPNKFSRTYLPSKKTVFTLHDPRGQEWPVEYVPHFGSLISGWHAFKQRNLEEDDCCGFELVKPTEFRVHIFRASG